MPQKILLINTTFKNGGAAQVAHDLFSYLNLNNITTHFAYGRGDKSSDNKTFKFGYGVEKFLHIFFVRFLGLEGFGSYFSTRKLIAYIKKEKFDLIHLHNIHGYYLNFYDLFKFLNTSDIPIVWTLHDEWLLTWLPAHSMGCNHCKTGEGNCINSFSYPKTYNKIFIKFALKKKQKAIKKLRNMHIISPAEWLAKEIRNSYLASRYIEIIHNGVNINLFKPSLTISQLRDKYGLPKDHKIILFSANDLKDKNKGVTYIIKAANLLKNEQHLFLGIGKGKISPRSNIKTLPYVTDRNALAEFYALSDLYCTASFVETQPLVVLEALSSGLPVIGFNILAFKELVNDENGKCVPFKNVPMLAEAIISNVAQDVQIKKSKNARNMAVTNFSIDKFFKNYINIYEKILK